MLKYLFVMPYKQNHFDRRVNEVTSPNTGWPAKCWLVALSSTEIGIVLAPLILIVEGTFFHTI
jgi:hypothetical protein